MESVTKKKAVICNIDAPTPVAYMNVYEEGDVWIKVVGCDQCPMETRLRCCGGCGMLLKDGGKCRLHMGASRDEKPFYCIVKPHPDTALSFCSLEYKCVEGSKLGKIRRVRDRGNVFVEG